MTVKLRYNVLTSSLCVKLRMTSILELRKYHKYLPNNGIQLTPSSAVFQMTLVGYASPELGITLVGKNAWVSWYRTLYKKETKASQTNKNSVIQLGNLKLTFIDLLIEIRNFFYVLLFLVILGSIFYYYRVQKIHVFTGEWHWNLFKYYGMNYEKEQLILFGVLFVVFMFLAKTAKIFIKTNK